LFICILSSQELLLWLNSKEIKMRINNSVFLIIIALVLGMVYSCEQTGKETDSPSTTKVSKEEGFAVLSQNCTTCHSPKEVNENPVAPNLRELQNSYFAGGAPSEDFVDNMTAFLLRPSTETAKMKDAVKKYGIMPNLGMSEAQYRAVATYLAEADLENPKWYEEVYLTEKENLENAVDTGAVDYLQKGKELALATKAVLGKNLLNAIQTKGTAEALSFCNERAIVLTDSMAAELNASIKRVSDNNRNPNNAANADELAYIQNAKKGLASGEQIKPLLQEINNHPVGYYPILTNQMCLQCHGKTDKIIQQATLEKINKLYPADKATGYGENELRGIWVVEMGKKE
jgi:mono/diheme cytochrome c family protein/nitrate reductase cytochrome c-type subunit